MRFAPQADTVHRATGLMLSAHYGASKLRWCLDHLPRVAEAAAARRLAFGPLASYLVFRLTEERTLACDPANAARTLLLNLEQLAWDEGLLHLFDLPRAALPAIVPTRFGYGHLAAGRRIPLEIVSGDQSAALFAYGAPQASSVYLNMGTGAFVQRTAGHYPGQHARLLSGVVLRDSDESVYVLEGTVNGAGAALAWAEQELGIAELGEHLAEWLARDGEPPLFLNGVSGLGAPFWVADFVSRFADEGDVPGRTDVAGGTSAGLHEIVPRGEPLPGMPAAIEPWLQAVAVAESIVFLLQANLDEFGCLASPPEQIIASGGLTHFAGLCQRISDLSGLPLYRPVEHEATARGLVWLLAHKPRAWPEAEIGTWFKPQSNAPLRARYTRWRAAMNQAVS